MDVNADGSVNILDALVIVNAVSGFDDGYMPKALDVNGDSLVDVGSAEAVIAARFALLMAEGRGRRSLALPTRYAYPTSAGTRSLKARRNVRSA